MASEESRVNEMEDNFTQAEAEKEIAIDEQLVDHERGSSQANLEGMVE